MRSPDAPPSAVPSWRVAGRPKLLTRPPRGTDLLARPRLLTADRPLVVLSGPAGTGTTSAALHQATADGGTIAWCRLAAGYDTAADVVAMVADTLGAEMEPARRVVELADQLLDLFERGPLSVVIDDHHLASDGDVDRVLAECIELLPPDGRIIVAGAARPAGLIGLVPAASREVIGPAELAFGDDEAIELFGLRGAPREAAMAWNMALNGWAQGVAAGAIAPARDPGDHLTALVDGLLEADPTGGRLVDAAASLAYVSAPIASAIGIDIAPGTLTRLAAASPLLVDHDGDVRMVPAAADRRLGELDPGEIARLRMTTADLLASDDPATAIDLFLDADQPERAADVLADHLSEIGVERALTWLYRLPAELRRRFPPVVAAGQATVEVDVALADAERRVEAADTERSRREALFALGSIEAHRGELAAAATAYEAALRASRDDPGTTARIAEELASTRWLLGDTIGARSAVDDLAPTPGSRWLLAQLDVGDGRMEATDEVVTDALSLAGVALRTLATGDDATARTQAGSAYALAVEGGGEPFVAAAVVRAWVLLRAGELDDALALADDLERRLGPRHQLARVHGAIIRERCSRTGDDRGRHDRDQRRLRDLRSRGYATIEALADLVLGGPVDSSATGAAAVEVCVLGEHTVRVGDRVVRRSEWRSKKALEVLTVIAAAGPGGARREQVIEAVWPDRDPDKGRTLLRTALSDIRRTLEPDRPAGEASQHLHARDDLLVLAGGLDLDAADAATAEDPAAAFEQLVHGLAPTVADAEWASDWPGRVERLLIRAASSIPDAAEPARRIAALEALVTGEPWQRDHYDRLAQLHRETGDEHAAADVERRWFADEG